MYSLVKEYFYWAWCNALLPPRCSTFIVLLYSLTGWQLETHLTNLYSFMWGIVVKVLNEYSLSKDSLCKTEYFIRFRTRLDMIIGWTCLHWPRQGLSFMFLLMTGRASAESVHITLHESVWKDQVTPARIELLYLCWICTMIIIKKIQYDDQKYCILFVWFFAHSCGFPASSAHLNPFQQWWCDVEISHQTEDTRDSHTTNTGRIFTYFHFKTCLQLWRIIKSAVHFTLNDVKLT